MPHSGEICIVWFYELFAKFATSKISIWGRSIDFLLTQNLYYDWNLIIDNSNIYFRIRSFTVHQIHTLGNRTRGAIANDIWTNRQFEYAVKYNVSNCVKLCQTRTNKSNKCEKQIEKNLELSGKKQQTIILLVKINQNSINVW